MTSKWLELWRWSMIALFGVLLMGNIHRLGHLGENHLSFGAVLFSLAIDVYFLFHYLVTFGEK